MLYFWWEVMIII